MRMPSIRSGIPTSGRSVCTQITRYISGSSLVGTTPLPPASSPSLKGKEKETEPEAVEHTAEFPDAISEFEAITRLYEKAADDQPPKKKRITLRRSQKSMVKRFDDFQGPSRLPPLSLRERSKWSCDAGDKHRFRLKGLDPMLASVPLTFGSGAVEGRVQRYQEIMKQQEENVQAIVEALGRAREVSGQGSSDSQNCGMMNKAPEARDFPSGNVEKSPMLGLWSHLRTPSPQHHGKKVVAASCLRKYETSANRNDLGEIQGVPKGVTHASSGDSQYQVGIDAPESGSECSANGTRSQDLLKNSVCGEFSTSWPGEKWKDDWGPDQLTAPRNHLKSPKPKLQNVHPSTLSTRSTPPRYRKARPRTLRHTTVRSAVAPNKPRLSGRLLKMLDDKRDSTKVDFEAFDEQARIDDPSQSKEISPPLSKKAKKRRKLALKAEAKKKALAEISAARALKRREVKSKRMRRKARAQEAAVKGVLKPLPPDAETLEDIVPPFEQSAIPRLAHGLDRVLFNPSVHWVQDPHSRVYNFPQNLQALPAVTDFAFERLGPYVRSSRDESLHSLALKHHKPFAGSTSSLTGFLSHAYFLISADRPVDISSLSMAFQKEPRTFTPGIRLPAKVVFHHRRYQVDENNQPILSGDSENGSHEPLCDKAIPNDVVRNDASKDAALHCTRGPDGDTIGGSSCPVSGTVETTDSIPQQNLRGETTRDASSTTVDDMTSLSSDSSHPQTGNAQKLKTSSPCAKPGQFLDTYAIDSGTGDPRDERIEELNVLLWLGTMAEKFLTLSESAFMALLRKNPANEVEPKRSESYRYAKSPRFVMRSQLDCQDTRLPGTGVFDIKTRAVLPVRLDRFNYLQNAGYLIRTMTGLYESFEREYYDLIRGAFLKYNFQARIGNMDGVFVAYHNTARMFGFQYVPVTEMEGRVYGPGSPGRGREIFQKCVGLLEVLCAEVVACFPGESVCCVVETRQGAGNMKVWVWPESRADDAKPIVELTTTVYHTMKGRAVSSSVAIDRANDDWEIHYKISRSSKPAHKIWSTLKEVQSREFAAALPEGVSAEELSQRLAFVNFGAGKGLDEELPETETAEGASDESEGSEVEVGRSKFAKAGRMIRHLRLLAKRGWDDIKREDALVRGQHGVVFGGDGGRGGTAREIEETARHVGEYGKERSEDEDSSFNLEKSTLEQPTGSPKSDQAEDLHAAFSKFHM